MWWMCRWRRCATGRRGGNRAAPVGLEAQPGRFGGLPLLFLLPVGWGVVTLPHRREFGGVMIYDDLFRLHKQAQDEATWLKYAGTGGQTEDPRRVLANRIEWDAAFRLAGMGYRVRRQGHNARADLIVEDCLRVEVKASRYYPNKQGGRYQARLHNRADVLLFCCVNGSLHFFVIPMWALRGVGNLAVWSYDPAEYGGQWAPYLENWQVLADALAVARMDRTYQLSFEEAGDGVGSVR